MDNRDLPDHLELPLTSGEPWWYWLGGRPALDFVNTLRERWRRRVETLVTPDDLVCWLIRAGLLECESRRVPRALLFEACELREAIDICVQATVAGDPAPAAAVLRIDRSLLYAATRPQLALQGDGQPVFGLTALGGRSSPGERAVRAALGGVALDAARMLGTPAEAARIRICASDTCSARFYDRSPAAARRWCSMTMCGNEAKARRHRARLREAPA